MSCEMNVGRISLTKRAKPVIEGMMEGGVFRY